MADSHARTAFSERIMGKSLYTKACWVTRFPLGEVSLRSKVNIRTALVYSNGNSAPVTGNTVHNKCDAHTTVNQNIGQDVE